MKPIEPLKQWIIANKYFFSIGSAFLLGCFIWSLIFRMGAASKILFTLVLIFGCTVYWLVRGGHYGDMGCE
jgi:hypothetical protein